jgi:hypothetical protein
MHIFHKRGTLLKSFTILSLVFLFTIFIYAQDLPEKIGSGLVSLPVKSLSDLNIKSTINGSLSIQGLYLSLPNTGALSQNARAPVGTFRYERAVYLITPSEMAAVGIPVGTNFTKIGWTYGVNGSKSDTANLKVYFQNTSDVTNKKSTSWSTDINPMTLTSNSTMIVPASGNIIQPLSNSSAFSYAGGGLYIAFEYANSSDIILSTGTEVNCNTLLTGGLYSAQSNTSLPATMNSPASDFRPETYLGFNIFNDAQVLQVYTLGKLPVPYSTPHQVVAAIMNNGSSTLNNLNVTLNITGANTFNDTKIISSLIPGSSILVTFSSWSPTIAGIDTIKVSVPADGINVNNSQTIIQSITSNTYTYAYGPFPPADSGGVGFTGVTGDFVAKFNTNLPASVNQVSVNFTVGGQPFKIGIWDATGTGGTPGSLLWESASQTSIAGVFTLLVNPKVNVSGNFYVGVRQTGTTNVAFAYQTEDPIRSSTFYFASPTGSVLWTDFASTLSTFRFMIEPRLTLANDAGVTTIDFPGEGTFNNITPNIAPKATIANFGSNNQDTPFNTTMNIYDATNALVYTSTKSLTLGAGTTQQVTFDGTFNPSAQIYKAKCFTTLSSDADRSNDSLSVSFNYSKFLLSITALIEAMYVYDVENGATGPVIPTVRIELHDANTYALVDSQTTLLSRSGVVTINSFTSALNSITGYYIVIKSPNTIETWSATAKNFSAGSLTYDFTTGLDKAYTDGTNPPLALHNGKYCIYSGDIDQNGLITSLDFAGIDNDNSINGYHYSNDLNGDYLITSADFTQIDNNNSLAIHRQVPNGTQKSRQQSIFEDKRKKIYIRDNNTMSK